MLPTIGDQLFMTTVLRQKKIAVVAVHQSQILLPRQIEQVCVYVVNLDWWSCPLLVVSSYSLKMLTDNHSIGLLLVDAVKKVPALIYTISLAVSGLGGRAVKDGISRSVRAMYTRLNTCAWTKEL